MIRRILLYGLVLSFFSLQASAQCPPNMNFSNGNLSYWSSYLQLYNGATKSNTLVSSFNTPPASLVAYNKILEQGSPSVNAIQILNYTGAATPKDSIVNTLSTVPNINGYQYNYSIKLGDVITKSKVRKLAYYISVPEGVTNYYITYAYALMLEDPGHTWDLQPRFTATVRNPALAPGQDTIKCASVAYEVPATAADKASQGFILANAANSIYYKDWTEVSVNLGVYAGETIILEFESDDCQPGGHFGYAYFSLRNDGCSTGSVTGNSIICANGTPITYSTPTVAGSSYTWTLPVGWTGSSTTNTITVTPNSNSGYITVTPTQSCGNISTRKIQVTTTTGVPAAPGIITGPTAVCSGSGNLQYSIAPVANASSYSWTLPAGWSIVSGADSATIVVNATSTGGNISVVAKNGCGSSAATSSPLTIQSGTANVGGVSTGGSAVCSGTNVTLTTTGNTGTILNWQSSTDGGVNWTNISNSASATYIVSKPSVSALYRVAIQTTPCSIAYSTATAVTINALPSISYQPANVSVCAGTNTSFSVVAKGGGITYQWQVSTNAGTSFSNIANAAPYTNATTATLNITNAIAGYTNYQYRCLITGTCGSLTSNTATLTIGYTAPVIVTQPIASSICLGSTKNLSVSATGTNLSYQWYTKSDNVNSGGTIIPGATSSSISISPATSTYYYCAVTATCSGTTATTNSTAVQITVAASTNVSVAINASPSTYLCPNTNTNVTFTATATNGGTAQYAWTKNNIAVGTNSATYQDASLSDKDVIAVSLTSDLACAINNPANATVSIVVAPPTISGNNSVCIGTTTTLTGAGTKADTNPWMSADQSIATVDANGVVTGVSVGSTTIIYNSNTGCSNSIQVTVKDLPSVASITGIAAECIGNTTTLYNATTGGVWSSSDNSIATVNSATGVVTGVSNGTINILYTTAVDNITGCANTISKSLTILASASITTQPSNIAQTICVNSTATDLTVAATGTGLTYQWYSNTNASNIGGSVLVGATNATYTPITTVAGTLYYYCVITNSTGCTVTSNASAAVNVVSSQISFTAQPVANTCANTNIVYTTQSAESNYIWTLPAGSVAGVDYTIIAGGVGSNSNTVTIAWLTAGAKTVTVKYTNEGGCGGSSATAASSTTTVALAPSISVQPSTSTQTICQNTSATAFSISATGTGLIYQWFSNAANNNTSGTYIDGARSSSFTPASSSIGANYYYATVSNANGCSITTSVTGLVTVNTIPVITSQPSSNTQSVCQGTAGTAISVTVTGSNLTYQWYRNTSAINSGGTLITGATNASYTPPNSLTAGVYYFYCIISNNTGCSVNSNISGFESVSNTSVPQITTQPVGGTYCSNALPTLSVVANSGGANGSKLTYQWYRTTNTSLSGATSSTYTPTSTSSRTYYVVVSNACSSGQTTTSSQAVVTVNRVASISTQPSNNNQTVCQNATATAFSLTASVSNGTNYTYQWYVNTSANNYGGTAITGASGSGSGNGNNFQITYTPATFSPSTFYYYCVITSNSCSVTSSVSGSVTINPSVTMQIGSISSNTTNTNSFNIPFTNTTADHYAISAGSPALSSFSSISSTIIPASPISVPLPIGNKTAGTYNFSLNLTSTASACSVTYTIPLTISNTSPGSIGSDQNICVNPTTSTYALTNTVSATAGSTYQWQSSTSKFSGYTNITNATSATYTVPTGLAQTTYYRRAATASSSTAYTDPVTIKVGAPTIITLTSGSISPSVCKSSALKNIVFSVTGDITGTTLTGSLPTGVKGVYDAVTGLYTISGTPTVSGTFNYTLSTTGACTNASTSGTITVNDFPAVSFSVSPASNNCKGSALTYTTSAGQSNYIWNLPGTSGVDYSITSGGISSSSNTVSLQYLTYGNKIVSINYTDANGCTAVSSTSNTTTINQPVASFVNAPSNTCNNATSIYTTQNSKSNYIWTISGVAGTDYSVVAGSANSNSNTVSVNWLTTGSKSVEVYYTDANSCVSATSALNTITVNSLPVASFSASATTACVNNNVIYTTQAGQTSYVWNVPGVLNTDYQIVAGNLSSSSATVTIKWLTAGTKNVTVNYNNSNGCASASAASVNTVVSATSAVFNVSPTSNSCINSNLIYTAPAAGNSNFIWTVPGVLNTDYQIVSGGIGIANNTVTLKWLTAGTKTVSINYSANGCAAVNDATSLTTVQAPTVLYSLEPNSGLCGGTNATYTIQPGNSNYLWTLPGIFNTDYTILSGGTSSDNSITVQWLTAGNQYVSAQFTDPYGCTTASTVSQSKAVYVPSVNLNANVISSSCVNSTITYTTETGNNNYVWSLPGTVNIDYTIVTGGTNTDNSLAVQWLKPGTQIVSVYYTDAHACTAQSVATNAILVNDIPVINLDYVTQVSTTATSFNIPYHSTTGFPDLYSIVTSNPELQGFTTMLNQSLVASPISINIPTSNANTYQFNFTVTNSTTGCASTIYTIPLVVTNINPGGISASQTICSGSTPNAFTSVSDASYYAASNGTISYQWQQSTNTINAGYVDINGATDKVYTSGAVSQTTYFRRKAMDGNSEAYSDPVTISINDLPIPLLTSTAFQNICVNTKVTYGTDAGQSNYTWILSGSAGTDYSIISGGTSSENQVVLKWLTGGVKNISINYADPNACTAAQANATTTTVNQVPVPSLNVSTSSAVCVGASSIVTYSTDPSKTFYTWDLSAAILGKDYQINAGGIGASDPTVTIQWLSAGVKKIGINYTDADGCTAVLETIFNTTVSAPNPTLTASTNAAICASSSITYTTDAAKSNYVWTFPNSTLNTDYQIVSGGTSTDNTVEVNWLSAGNRTVGINYTEAGCTAVNATTVSNIVYALPSISLGAYTTSVPVSTISNFSIPFSSTTQSPDKFSVDGSALTGFVSIVNHALPVSPITVSIPSILEGSYTLNLTVKNSTTGCVSNIYPIQVIVTNVDPGSISGTQSICTGASANAISSTAAASGAGSIVYSWQLSTTSSTSGFSVISNATGLSYSPGVLAKTTYFRRGASDASTTAYTSAVTVTVNPNPSIVLNSVSTNQTVCENTALTDIVFTIAGANNANASGLPNGINGRYNSYTGLFTISGIPTSTSSVYTVTATSAYGCSDATTSGTITVTPLNTIILSSAAGTNAQVKCVNSAITNITYNTTGATGASISGLPTGVTGNWSANTITISGTPSTAGTYNYSIILTGGCGTITKTGSINVHALPSVSISADNASATICANTTIIYNTEDLQSNYSWQISGVNGTDYVLNAGGTANDNTASITWLVSGSKSVAVNYVDVNGCTANSYNSLSKTITGLNTITLSSATGTDAQTVCANSAIVAISYNTTGATDGIVTGLPNGVSGSWLSNVFAITGSPTVAGTYNYTITLSGGCGIITTTGSLIVSPEYTIALSSALGTDAQYVCNNNAITTITYATTVATDATVSGLPAGVSGVWSADVLTISGTPTVAGVYNYTVTLIGGCGNNTTTGSITVNNTNTSTLSSGNGTDAQSVCINTAISNITYTTTAATGATFSGLPAGVTGNWAANTVTISGTPSVSGTFNYTVSLTGGCGSVSSNGSITVRANNSITLSSAVGTNAQSKCINTAITNITYATTAATGATFSGLPTGVNGNWAANMVTISGTPSVSGTFNYTVTLTGGCGNITASGSIVVNALPSAAINNPVTSELTCSTTSIDLTATGGGTYSWSDGSNTLGTNATLSVANTGTYTVTVTSADGCTATASKTITQNITAPIAAINTATATELNCTTTSISLTATGGGTYSWSDGTNTLGTNATMSVTNAGTYTVTVTSANGCSATASKTITQNTTAPSAAINNPVTSELTCSTTSIDLTATGGGTYSWSDGTSVVGTNATLSVITAGTYTVTVTIANGCSATASKTITQNTTAPSAAINNPVTSELTCSTTSIDLTATGGGTYSWSDGTSVVGTNATLSVITAGTYTVTVTSANGCSATASKTITQNTTAPSAAINNPVTSELTCSTTSIDLTATGGGTYSWSDGTSVVGTNATLSVITAGTYTVTVTSANGCSATASKTITQTVALPSAAINNPVTSELTCSTTSIDLTATGGGTYSWSDGSNTLGTNATLSVANTGTYTVTVTSADGCTATASKTITQNITAPIAAINTATATELNCTTTSISLTATGGGTYSWSDGTNTLGTNATMSVTNAGTYTVTVTSANGCSATASKTITQNTTAPSAAINNPVTTILTCSTTSIDLTATGGGTYSWSDGINVLGSNAALSITTPGTYAVTVTSANGCAATSSKTITQNTTAPSAAINNPVTSELTCSTTSIDLTATGGGTYSWSDGTSVVGTNATLSVITAGTYTVTVTSANGCSATASKTITQNTTAPSAAINNPISNVLTANLTSIDLIATGGGTYSWSDGTNVLGINAALSVTTAGTYIVTVTSVNGCKATTSKTITQNSIVPTAMIETPSNTILNCTITSLQLIAKGTGTYSWSDGSKNLGSSSTLVVTEPGVYTLTVTNSFGNTASASKTISQDISQPRATIAPILTAQLTCKTTSITLVASGGNAYQWNDGTNNIGTDAQIIVTSAGLYTVTVMNSNGCTASASQTISQDITKPTAGINTPVTTELSSSVKSISLSANGSGTYIWSNASNIVSTDSIFIVTNPGNYTVTITNLNGCSTTSSMLTIRPAAPITSSATFFTNANINPTDLSGQVIGLDGAKLIFYSSPSGWNIIPVPTMPVVPGVYTYYVCQVLNNIRSVIVPLTIKIMDPIKVIDIQKSIIKEPELQSDGSYVVGFSIKLKNYTNQMLDSVMVTDNLINVFGLNMPYQVVNLVSSGFLFVNSLYDGNVIQDLLLPESKITSNETDSIQLTVKFYPKGYVGDLTNTAKFTTKSMYGLVSEFSNDPLKSNGTNARIPTRFIVPLVEFSIPSGFSPNRDGINDYFIVTKPYNTTIQLEVYNRWGNLVYQNPNYTNNWDGKGYRPADILGDELSDGTYYYVIVAINNFNRSQKRFAGYVIIKR